jgi:AcrR family transcriptional regulator
MNDPHKCLLGRPRSAKSHQAMLQATLELLGEVGFESMSIEAIASRAKIGKATIYRRYTCKEELVADAIEQIREEIIVPDTGSLAGDLNLLIENAAQISLTPIGRQAIAMIVSSAASNPEFARIYWTKYLAPRRTGFAVVIERAKARSEVSTDLDSGIVFDTIGGIMLYAIVFPPTLESWTDYVHRALNLLSIYPKY